MEQRKVNIQGQHTTTFQPQIDSNGLNGKEEAIRQRVSGLFPHKGNNISLEYYLDSYDKGHNCAIVSKALVVREEDMRPGIEHAQAMARYATRDKYDPDGQPADKLRENEFKKLLAERDELISKIKYTESRLLELNQEFARVRPLGKPATPPPLILKLATGAVIGMVATLTAHDCLLQLENELLAKLIAAGFGIALGAAVVKATLDSSEAAIDAPVGRSKYNHGVMMGVLIGLGSLAIRLTQVADTEGNWFVVGFLALGLSAFEIAMVMILHKVADRYRCDKQQSQQQEQLAGQMTARIAVEEDYLRDCQSRLNKIQEIIEQGIDYLDERQVRHDYNKEIEELVAKGYTHGYSDGVAENQGKIISPKKGGAK